MSMALLQRVKRLERQMELVLEELDTLKARVRTKERKPTRKESGEAVEHVSA